MSSFCNSCCSYGSSNTESTINEGPEGEFGFECKGEIERINEFDFSEVAKSERVFGEVLIFSSVEFEFSINRQLVYKPHILEIC